jgi:hypothetical protein
MDVNNSAYESQTHKVAFAEKQLSIVTATLKKEEQRMAEQKKYAANIARNIKGVGEQISDALRDFDESIVGTRISSWAKLSDARRQVILVTWQRRLEKVSRWLDTLPSREWLLKSKRLRQQRN